jgi:hypothetical protein
MGLLNLFSKSPEAPKLEKLPTGSFTVDRTGKIAASTLPASYPAENVRAIGELVMGIFQSAQRMNVPLREIHLSYAAVKINARELRGGAMIFLTPRTK